MLRRLPGLKSLREKRPRGERPSGAGLASSLRARVTADLMKKAFMADTVLDVDKLASTVLAGYAMIIAGVLLAAVGMLLVINLYVSPFIALAVPLALLVVGGLTVLSVNLKTNLLLSNRRFRIEKELPFISMFMTLTASLNLPLQRALREALRIDFFRQFKKEIHFIEKIRLFYIMSYTEALEYISRFHPSMQLREFYQTLVAGERAGGDKYRILLEKTSFFMKILEDRINRLIERFSTITNLEVMLFVVIPLALIIIGALFAGNQGLTLAYMASIGIPFLSFLVMLFVVQSIYPEELAESPPRRWLLIGLGLELFIFVMAGFVVPDRYFLYASIEKYEFTGLLMAITAIGFGIYFRAWYREADETFYSIPTVTRYIAEEGKKGKTPKQAIIGLTRFQLPSRMNSLIRIIAARVSLGISIREAIRGLRLPWLANLYFQLLDTADRYGADPRSLDLLAGFTEDTVSVARIIEDRSLGFKLGALIAIISLVLGFTIVHEMVLSQFTSVAATIASGAQAAGFGLPIQPVSEDMLPILKSISYTGIVLNTFFISLLAGKTVKGSIAAGFLFAGLNILIVLASVRIIAAII